MDKSVLRGVLLLANALVSLALALYSLGFEKLASPLQACIYLTWSSPQVNPTQ